MKIYTGVWVVFVLASLAAALVVGCGSVTARGDVDGAGGELGPDAGQVGTGGAGGLLEEAGAGGRGGAQVDAQAPADVGPHVGATTAPACRGAFVGAQSECPRVTLPDGHTLQCEVGCSSLPADNAGGCLANGVTYCVSSCSACVP